MFPRADCFSGRDEGEQKRVLQRKKVERTRAMQLWRHGGAGAVGPLYHATGTAVRLPCLS